ncbi:Lrp/AsnC family transcriptional regulator [Candidatus Woesearchaeota archaeon]|nr:Lrp/AsnC family transcriptional regulator [Candidatus Woesearchaeota archaeon]
MEKKVEMKKIEQKVLGALSVNARASCSFIAKQIKTSEQRVSYTINSLVKKKIIKRFYTLLDYSRFGVIHFRVLLKLSYVSKEKLQEFIDFLIQDSHTFWIANLGGRYDLVCTFVAPNPSYFNKHFRSIIEQFPQQIQHYSILTTIVIRHYGRKHLINGQLQEKIIGGDREHYSFQADDLQLLSLLADDARKNSVALASEMKVTAKTIISRIKRFQEQGILRAYRPFLNMGLFQYRNLLLLLKYHNVSVDEEQRLVAFLCGHPYVLNVIKLLGEWDLQLDIEVPTMEEFRKLELEIRSQFPTLIKDSETLFLYQEHKKTFFPRFLVEKNK